VTRSKRDFGTIRKRVNGRWQAYYDGLDQDFHRAPAAFTAKSDAEAWLAAERRLIQNDEWTPAVATSESAPVGGSLRALRRVLARVP